MGPLRPTHGRDYVVAVDVGLKKDRTVAAVCHAEPLDDVVRGRMPSTGDLQVDRSAADADVVHLADWYGRQDAPQLWRRDRPARTEAEHRRGSRIVLDRMEVWQGSGKAPVRLSHVEKWVVQAAASFKAKVIFDPFQMVGTAQRLQERGVHVEEFVFSSASRSPWPWPPINLLSNAPAGVPRSYGTCSTNEPWRAPHGSPAGGRWPARLSYGRRKPVASANTGVGSYAPVGSVTVRETIRALAPAEAP